MKTLHSSDHLEVTIEWLGEQALLPGRRYDLKLGDQQVSASVSRLKYRLDGHNGQSAARTLSAGESAVCNLALSSPIKFQAFELNSSHGSFTLHHSDTGKLLGRGTIFHGLHRASNLHWQFLEVDKQARARLKRQKPCVLWFSGFSGSGKSTIANIVEKKLNQAGKHSYILDGDNIRHGLNRDLGFTDADRIENIRRVAETAKLLVDAGLIVISSFISPFKAERSMARSLFDDNEFIEVFIDSSLEQCERHDPKGLYAKARRGELKNFTGIDSVYEAPAHAEIHIQTKNQSAEQAADAILAYLKLELSQA
ncbi:MAG: adenylyl-sulfate kinase [SAR86 cluster bacterium]|uniref:Adenylyl-sulfate kinase n=1 Tax=SAR86 cluster bacterium TaxID=2030880 RepID=A0A2A4MTW6_9GAMM|nr:MAG: adenylyl-sulfate kinase [SAR86 cluster bacterium]